MRMRGLEPPRACAHTALNRARLPIPPHPRGHSVARLLATPRRLFGLRRGLLVLAVASLALPLAGAAARPPPRAPGPEGGRAPPLPRPGPGGGAPPAPRGTAAGRPTRSREPPCART